MLLYHANVGWARGGFLGVDVFFVLSGYLITTLLVREHETGGIRFRHFYVRRARRLLPALVLMVTGVAAWAALSSATDRLGQIRGDGIAALLYVANWRFVLVHQSYFDQFADPSPFRHMWSLAIEEQYYLFFPLLLVALLRTFRGRRTTVGIALATLALISALMMAWLYQPGLDPSRVYFGTDTRIQELFVGAALALVLGRLRPVSLTGRFQVRWLGVVAAVSICGAYVGLTDTGAFLYLGGFLLVCLIVGLLIASVELEPGGPVARLLTWRPLVWIGTVSYGLYLWHWPIFIALGTSHTGLSGTSLLTARFLATFVVATASYYLVEAPIRSGQLLRRLPQPWGQVSAVGAMPVALVALLWGTAGATPPPDGSPFAVDASRGTGATRVLIIGDSVAQGLAERFPISEYPQLTLQSSTSIGCGLIPFERWADGPTDREFLPACDPWFNSLPQTVATDGPDLGLIMFGNGPQFDALLDGHVVPLGSPEHRAFLRTHLNALITMFSKRHIPVSIVNMTCHGISDPGPVGQATNDENRITSLNQLVGGVAASRRVQVIDLNAYLCPDGFSNTLNGQRLYEDGLHFTAEGADQVWRFILSQTPSAVPRA